MFVTGALMQHPVSLHLDQKVTELTQVGRSGKTVQHGAHPSTEVDGTSQPGTGWSSVHRHPQNPHVSCSPTYVAGLPAGAP